MEECENVKPEFHIVSFSGGKDSTAMLLKMLEERMQIDCILFCDTGLEFPGMYAHLDELEKRTGQKITRVKNDLSFEYLMFEKPVIHKNMADFIEKHGNDAKGYGWAGPRMRWCTGELKDNPRERFLRPLREKYHVIEYVGLAADEEYRLERKNNQNENHRHPLIEWKMSEADCLSYCYERGYYWDGLYEQFNRVSCWCCPLQSLSELRNLRKYHPELWERLKEWDKKTWRNFRADYSAEELDIRFQFEEECLATGIPVTGKKFFKTLRERIKASCEGVIMSDTRTQYYMADINELIPYARNARTHSDLQIDQIAASIKEFGFLSPIIIAKDNTILCGHGRYYAAKKLGLTKIPCVKEEYLTETQKKAYILADNRIGMNAGWDNEMLMLEITDLQGADFDVGLTGFNEKEIAELFIPEEESRSPENKEFNEEDFGDEEFEHECPRCGFRFN